MKNYVRTSAFLLNKLNKLSGYVVFFVALIFSINVSSQDLMRIVAIVNDDIISFYDVNERMKLINSSSNVPNDPQSQSRLADQVLRALIDEKLKLQEAKTQNIRVQDMEIQEQLNEIARNNNLTLEKFIQFLVTENISVDTMKHQIHSQIAWTKTLTKTVRPNVYITDEEIDEEIARLKNTNSATQKRVFDIFIATDSAQSEISSKQLVDNILAQIAAGENFSTLARNYSQSTNASVGGDMGWISPGQLPDALDATLSRMNPGDAPAVIESASGIHILIVRDERSITGNLDDTKFDLSQVIVPLDESLSEKNKADLSNYLLEIVQESPVCSLSEDKLSEFEGAKLAFPKAMRMGDMSTPIKDVLTPLETGDIAKPLILGDKILLITICKRYDPTSNLPTRRDIGNNMGQQRLELLARQYLRDVRNSAYIDIRM